MMRRALAALLTLIVGGGLLASNASADHTGSGEFQFMVAIDEDSDGEAENFAVDVQYRRSLNTPSLDAPAGWVDGDRRGYFCGYAFLTYRGFIVGRASLSKFTDPNDPDNAYIELQDKHMHEGVRNFDGQLSTEGITAGGGEPQADEGQSCPGAAVEDYAPLTGEPSGPPVITFQHGPHAIEVRDFADELDVDVDDPSIVFDVVEQTPTKVVTLIYQDGGALPAASIYYELIPDVAQGLDVGETTPGTMHHVSLHVGCGLTCVHSHDPEPEPTPSETPTVEPTPTTEPEPTPTSCG